MPDTTFVPGTPVTSAWLNDINDFVYDNQFVYDLPTAGAATGAALIGFLQAGTGATALTAQTKMRQSVDVADFGAPTSGDASAAFLAACTAVSALGGGVVHFKQNYSILTNLTIPDSVHLRGELISPGQLQAGGVGGDYDSLGSVLKVASTATITIGNSGSLSNCVVIRSGLDLPFANLAAAQAGVPLFAGTAVTIGGSDAKVENVLFLGFATAILSSGKQRMKFYNVQGDCTTGIDIANAVDVVYFDHCHFWPFTTANYSWTASDATQLILTRAGFAYHLHDTVDWPQMTNCFSYGYLRGMRLHNTNSARITAVAHDGPVNAGVPAHSGSIGVLIEGTSIDNSFTSVYCAGKSDGFYANASSGNTSFTSCDTVACTRGLDVNGAQDVHWEGGLSRNCSYAFQVSNGTTNVKILNAKVRDYLTKPMNVGVANARISVINMDFTAPAAGASMSDNATNWTLPSVASADPLNLPGHVADTFLITGTTNFGTLNGGYPGRRVTLFFGGSLSVLNGASMRLNGSANFAAVSGSSITFVWSGTQWREVGRCA